jgi:hypothetical protein
MIYYVSIRKIGGWRDFGEGSALPKPIPLMFGRRGDFGEGSALPKPIPLMFG